MDRRRLLLGLAVGCHPGPTATVTILVTVLARAAGQTLPRLAWVALAVLAGQLAVGWCNDARDAGRDLRAGRMEKPTCRGWVTARDLTVGAVVAGALCVPLSLLAAGPVGGSAHVVAVGSALVYDLWLKTTVASIVPWIVSFGLLPAFVTYGLAPARPPAAWVVLVGVLLGCAAHLANSARDIDSDTLVHATGLAGVLGSRTSRTLAVLSLLAASAVLLWQVRPPAFAAVLVLLLLATGSIASARWRGGRRLFEAILAMAAVDVLLLVAAASSISA